MELIYTIKNNDNFINIKQILKEKFEISDRLLLKLKNKKLIFLNNVPSYVNQKVVLNDTIRVNFDFEEDNSNVVPSNIKLDIIYEDEFYLVLNKPANMPIHPSMAHYTNSLSNGVRYYFDKINLKKKIRPVNRLDKDTSGIVIFAKNEYIQECLVRQMKNKTFIKQYIAICKNNCNTELTKKEHNVICAPIARKPNSIIERCISDEGDIAITYYSILEKSNNNLFKILCTLETGRTHQIRVHLSYIGLPILGDTLYGYSSILINRQALHSYKTNFIHPITKQQVEYVVNLPEDMNNLLC